MVGSDASMGAKPSRPIPLPHMGNGEAQNMEVQIPQQPPRLLAYYSPKGKAMYKVVDKGAPGPLPLGIAHRGGGLQFGGMWDSCLLLASCRHGRPRAAAGGGWALGATAPYAAGLGPCAHCRVESGAKPSLSPSDVFGGTPPRVLTCV